MGDIIKAIEFLGVPATISIVIISVYIILQIIGEFVELGGKVVPEFFKVRKYFKRKKEEEKERLDTLKEVKQLLTDVNQHYSEDNIAKRNDWMKDVDNRAVSCGSQMTDMQDTLLKVVQALDTNTRMTEDLFVENSRDRIIDFAEKASDYNLVLSKEQFRRIDRIYNEYEEFLKAKKRQNGEVDTAYAMIQDGYRYRLQHRSFLEDIKEIRLNNN